MNVLGSKFVVSRLSSKPFVDILAQSTEASFVYLSRGVKGGRMKRWQVSFRSNVKFFPQAIIGKEIGFDKVIGTIDKIIAEIAEEQTSDAHKKE